MFIYLIYKYIHDPIGAPNFRNFYMPPPLPLLPLPLPLPLHATKVSLLGCSPSKTSTLKTTWDVFPRLEVGPRHPAWDR